jgi:hypothetical protein
MTFFARPNLDNIQFEQQTGSTLTLCGQTQIATATGLMLATGSTGDGVIITASGASIDNQVLTYDSVENVIKLKDPTASGGTGIYTCTSPSTCTVGGLPSGSDIYGSGVTTILECILAPTVDPSVADLFNSLSISPTTTLYEVGSQPTICAVSGFDRGLVNPLYCGTDPNPAGLPSSHVICAFGDTNGVTATTTNLSTYCEFTPIISYPSNYVYSCVNYSAGATPVYRSDGSEMCPVEPAGATLNKTCNITGVYPWFWGTDAVAPDVSTSGCTQCLVDSYSAKICQSNLNVVTVSNFNVTGEYIWITIPAGYTKTCWQGANNVSNNGVIPGGLFPTPTSMGIASPESCWGTITPVGYEIYVSNYATDINYGMTFCN